MNANQLVQDYGVYVRRGSLVSRLYGNWIDINTSNCREKHLINLNVTSVFQMVKQLSLLQSITE